MLPRLKKDSGIILIIVSWILVILTMLVLGLARRTNLELNLTKYTVGKSKSKYIAVAGLIYGVDKILEDTKSSTSGDTKFQCGFSLGEGQTPEDLFKKIKVGSGYFDIAYSLPQADKKNQLRYGLEDEESKININALTPENYTILEHLIVLLGYEEGVAQTIASSVLDWRDENDDVFNNPFGAENSYYLSLAKSYPCKNQPFDSLEELLLVRGMTADIFKSIKPYVTIFPRNNRLLINFDTASVLVLQAMARSMTTLTNTALEDADNLAKKMDDLRRGEDGLLATADDKPIETMEMMNHINVNNEGSIFSLMSRDQTKISSYLRLKIKGVDEDTGVSSLIEAVVHRDDFSIVYWHRS